MYEESLALLEACGVEFEEGLTFNEVTQIEELYEIKFPESLLLFLTKALPVSKGFYNWRNTEVENINCIKKIINQPLQYINDMPEEIYWCEDWGKAPENEKVLKKEVRQRLSKAPKLIPIFSHRYMPMTLEKNPPIISVHGIDVIYYGEDIEDYFKIEFGGKDPNSIKYQNIKKIQFWTDIM